MSDLYSTTQHHMAAEQLEEAYWRSLLSEGEQSHHAGPPDPAAQIGICSAQASERLPEDWEEAERLMSDDSTLTLTVMGSNRGGLLVEWRSLRGFVPASQLVHFSVSDAFHGTRQVLSKQIGETLTLRIIEIDAARNRLILSERAAQVGSGERSRLLYGIQQGDVLTAHITNLVDFGAFADLGGVEGLIHISELSWGRVSHPADFLQRGQTVEVYVMDIDPAATRIALSIKRLRPDPWATVEHRYRVGEMIEGKITSVVDFGAFACIEEGLEGLIHFSELAEGHFLHPRNVVQEGDYIRARILSIDGKARRLGLTLRER